MPKKCVCSSEQPRKRLNYIAAIYPCTQTALPCVAHACRPSTAPPTTASTPMGRRSSLQSQQANQAQLEHRVQRDAAGYIGSPTRITPPSNTNCKQKYARCGGISTCVHTDDTLPFASPHCEQFIARCGAQTTISNKFVNCTYSKRKSAQNIAAKSDTTSRTSPTLLCNSIAMQLNADLGLRRAGPMTKLAILITRDLGTRPPFGIPVLCKTPRIIHKR